MGKKETLSTIEELNASLPSKSSEEKLPSLEELNSGLKKKVETTPSPLESQPLPEISGAKLASLGGQSDLTPGTSEPQNFQWDPAAEQKKISPPDQSLKSVTSHQTTGDINTTGGTSPDQSVAGKVANAVAGNEKSQSFLKGTAALGASLARSPQYLADLTNRAINTVNPIPQVTGTLPTDAHTIANPVAESLESAAKNIGSDIDKNNLDAEGNAISATDHFAKGEYAKGFNKMMNSVAESMPTTISLIAGNAAGIEPTLLAAGATPVFAAGEKQSLKENNPGMTDEQMNNVSAVSGALESITESMFGNVKLGTVYKDLLKKEGAEAVKKTIGGGVTNVFKKALTPYVGNMAEEMSSEMSNQYLDNLNHIYIGGDDKVKPFDNVMEAGIVAIGSAGSIGAPTVPISALNHVRQKADAEKAQKIKDQQEAIRKEIKENPDINPITKSTLVTQLHGLNAEEDALIKKATDEHGKLPDDKKEHVDNLLKKNSEIATAALDPNITKETKDALVAQIDKNDEKVKEVYKENEKLLKEKEAAAKKETDAKKESEKKETEHKEELDYLSHLKNSIGLDEVEQNRYDELAPKTEAQKEVATKTETNATEKGNVEKSDESKHQNGNESRKTTETGSSDSVLPSTQKQEKIEPVAKKEEVKTVEKAKFEKLSHEAQSKVKVGDELYYPSSKGKVRKVVVNEVIKDDAGIRYNIGDKENPFTPNSNKFLSKKEVPRETSKAEKVKISNQEFERTVDKNGKATYTNVKDGVALPEDTTKYRQLEDARRAKEAKQEPVATEEAPAEKPKTNNKPKEELVNEEDIVPETKDDAESVQKLNDDIAVMKGFDKKDLVEKKYTGMLHRAFKMRDEGKISKATFTEYKKKAQQVLGGKLNLDKEELGYKVDEIAKKLKDKLLGEGYKKIVLSAGAPITPQNIADLIDLTANIVKRGISAGFTLKKAADNALEAIKKHPAYKKLMATEAFDEKEFESQVRSEFPKEKKPAPQKAKRRSVKSLSTNLYESENLIEDSKKIIKDQGLDREVMTNKEASDNARKIIDEIGITLAVALAKDKNSDIPGGTRALIFGHALNDLNKAETNAKTHGDKERLANIWADYAIAKDDFLIEFQKQSTDAGRFSSALGEFYKSSPLGIKLKEQKEIERTNMNKKNKMRSTKKRFTDLAKELDAIEKEYTLSREKPAPDKLKEIKDRRKVLFSKLKDSFGTLGFAATPENIAKLQHEQLKMVFDIAKTYFEEGAIRTKDLFAKLNKDLKAETGYTLSDEDMEHVLNQPYENKTFREVIAEKEAPIEKKEKREKQIKAIQKALKKNLVGQTKDALAKTREVPRTEAERLLDVYDKGVPKFFEDVFYEKFGLTDINKPEVQKKLDEFSAKIANAPEGVLRNNEQVKYLNWLKDYRQSKYLELGMSAWYASILSSYETHARNLQFNGVTSLVTMPLLLAQKSIAKGNFKDVIKLYGEFFHSFKEGAQEAKGITKRGQISRFEDVAPSNALERSRWTKWMVYPGRFLRSSDIQFTIPLYNMKLREIFSRVVDAEAKEKGIKLTPELRSKTINDLMGQTEERVQNAENQSKQEIEKIYGPEWEKDSEAALNQKIRQHEIIDQSRPLTAREEARSWAKKALLTNKPEGLFGVLSDGIGFFLNWLPPLRAVVPFINVPINITNQIIERSPLGFVTPIRGKIGMPFAHDITINGKSYGRELTDEERKELYLKATNYTVLLGAVFMAAAMGKGLGDDDDETSSFIVTGKEGDYFRNKGLQQGGGLEPYTVYIGGIHGLKFNYQNTPLASIFSPVGFYRDYRKYEEVDGKKKVIDGIAHSTIGYLNQVIDATSMKGMKEIFKYADADERKRMADDGYKKEAAKKLNTLFPYSGLVKATTKDVRGLIGVSEKAPHDFVDYLTAGLPFDYYQDKKVDILGREIKSQFDIPIIPIQKKNFTESGGPDPYYEVFRKKNYDPTTKFIKTKNAYTDKRGEFELTKKELYDLNKEVGKIAFTLVNRVNKKTGKTLWSKMQNMPDGRFSDQMNKVLQDAQSMARIKTFVLDGKLPAGKTLKSIYKRYHKVIQKDKTKEKLLPVL